MSEKELKRVLDNHAKWLKDKKQGARANLNGADLSHADLRGANLRGANLRGSNLRGADLTHTDLSYSDLRGVDLSCADLRGSDLNYSDLRGADLRDSDLDFSCFPLWCGGLNLTVDEKLPLMLAAFICSMKCDDMRVIEMQSTLHKYAEQSHRASDILND